MQAETQTEGGGTMKPWQVAVGLARLMEGMGQPTRGGRRDWRAVAALVYVLRELGGEIGPRNMARLDVQRAAERIARELAPWGSRAGERARRQAARRACSGGAFPAACGGMPCGSGEASEESAWAQGEVAE